MENENKKRVEEMIGSEYTTYLLEKKANQIVKERIDSYKGKLKGFLAISITVLGFLGYQQWESYQYFKKTSTSISNLESDIKTKLERAKLIEASLTKLYDSLGQNFNITSSNMEVILESVKSKDNFLSHLTLLNRGLFESLEGKNSQISQYVDDINRYYTSSSKLSVNLSNRVDEAQEIIASLNREELVTEMNEFRTWVRNASQEQLFTIKEGARDSIVVGAIAYAIDVMEVQREKAKIKFGNQVIDFQEGQRKNLQTPSLSITVNLIRKSGLFDSSDSFVIMKIAVRKENS